MRKNERNYIMNKDCNIVVREIEEQDYNNGLLQLYEEHFFIQSKNINESEFRKFIQRKSNDYKIFGFFDKDNKIIACASCFIEHKLIHNFGRVAHIEDVVVSKKYRGKKYGQKIIDHCVNYAKHERCYKIILNCVIENICFYEKCGFENNGALMVLYT